MFLFISLLLVSWLWLCVHCRKLFANRTLHAFLEEKIRPHPNNDVRELHAKVAELTNLVTGLQKQVNDNQASIMTKLEQKPVVWPTQSDNNRKNDQRSRSKRSRKRRCGSNGEPIEVEPRAQIPNGTSDIDLSDLQLSCPITAAPPPPRFWLYLTGCNPKMTEDDMVKVVKRCLTYENDVAVFRLVPKDADISKYTFVSFKIGLDPSVKDIALDPSKWPPIFKVREFDAKPKNDSSEEQEGDMEIGE